MNLFNDGCGEIYHVNGKNVSLQIPFRLAVT